MTRWWVPILTAVLTLAASTAVAVLTWSATYRNALKQDRDAKRREIKVGYLIEAYRRIESAAGRHLDDPEDEEQMRCKRNFEDALGDILLFGSDDQMKLATKMAESLVASNRVDANLMDELLVSLRRDLRDELELPQADDPLVHLRINLSRASPPSLPPGGR